jgi:hypothetical protein
MIAFSQWQLIAGLNPMHTAGLLTLRTKFHAGRWGVIAVSLRRPAVAPVFLGKTPAAVVQTVPLLYSVCAQAQQRAAQAALDGAVGLAPTVAPATELWMEMLHEILWRVMLDWPPAVGLPAEKAAFVAWRSARSGQDAFAVTEKLCRGLVTDLSAKCQERLPASPMAVVQDASLPDPVAWLDFCVGKTHQMPALQAPVSIRAAYQGRIAQLQVALHALGSQAPYPVASAAASGWGVAQVATARGMLTHAAQVKDGRVCAYRVWAPTDAFFSDGRAVSSLLEGETYATELQASAALELAVMALDPCVPFEVESDDA